MNSYVKPTRKDMLQVVHPLLADAAAVRHAFVGVRNKADVVKTIGLLAEAAWYPKPRWYAPLRLSDTYVATLRSGEVLALSAHQPGVPQELFAWSSEYSGTVIWREDWNDGADA